MTPLYNWAVSKYGEKEVNEKLQQIIDLTVAENESTRKIQIATDSTLTHLDMHISENRNIEYVNMGSPLVEYALKRIIQAYEFTINAELLLADFNTLYKVEATGHKERTLGKLIAEFKKFNRNSILLGELENYRMQRNKVTHNLYKEYQDIKVVNDNLKNFVSQNPIKKLVALLSNEHRALVKGLTDRLFEFGVTLRG